MEERNSFWSTAERCNVFRTFGGKRQPTDSFVSVFALTSFRFLLLPFYTIIVIMIDW